DLPANQTLSPYADLAASIASQHAAVSNQRDLATHAGSADRRPHPAVPSADDDEIIRLCFGRAGQAEGVFAPVGEGLSFVGWNRVVAGREKDRVATTVEAGQISQSEFHFAGVLDLNDSTGMPAPVSSRSAERRLQFLAVDKNLKLPWVAWSLPSLDPVERADEDVVFAGLGKGHGRRRIFDRPTQPVGEQIG